MLAASVLDDLDVDLDDEGVRMPGCSPLQWSDLARTAAGAGEEVARLRVADLLHAHLELHRGEVWTVPLAIPVGADRHPAYGWTHTPQLGGALDLGLGVVVRGESGGRVRERTLPVPVASARATGRSSRLSDVDLARLEDIGALVARRLVRDAGSRGLGATDGLLRPVAGCDVPTLLASRTLREHLVAGPDRAVGNLLRAVAIPDRTRGWFDLARIDPAYVGAAWMATDAADRGFRRPVLVTLDEVALAPSSPRLVERVLAD